VYTFPGPCAKCTSINPYCRRRKTVMSRKPRTATREFHHRSDPTTRENHAPKMLTLYRRGVQKTVTKPAWYLVCTANSNFFHSTTHVSFWHTLRAGIPSRNIPAPVSGISRISTAISCENPRDFLNFFKFPLSTFRFFSRFPAPSQTLLRTLRTLGPFSMDCVGGCFGRIGPF
jgi:hypothetical protein